jgi:hypothetical protein
MPVLLIWKDLADYPITGKPFGRKRERQREDWRLITVSLQGEEIVMLTADIVLDAKWSQSGVL